MIKPPFNKIVLWALFFNQVSSLPPSPSSSQTQQLVSLNRLKEIIDKYYREGNKHALEASLAALANAKGDVFSSIDDALVQQGYYLFADEYSYGYDFLLGKVVPDAAGNNIRKRKKTDYLVLEDILIKNKRWQETNDPTKAFRALVEKRKKNRFIINRDTECFIAENYYDQIKAQRQQKKYTETSSFLTTNTREELLERDLGTYYDAVQKEKEQDKKKIFFEKIERSLFKARLIHEPVHIKEQYAQKKEFIIEAEAKLKEIAYAPFTFVSLYETLFFLDLKDNKEENTIAREQNELRRASSQFVKDQLLKELKSEQTLYTASRQQVQQAARTAYKRLKERI